MIDNSPMRIPVSATMKKTANGDYVMVDAEYAEITPDQFARFLLQKFGVDAIFKGKEDNEN